MLGVAEAGRKGPDVRSDCWIRVSHSNETGVRITLRSKVASMYGRQIREAVAQGCERLGVEGAEVEIDDSGALPFVLMARLETAVRRAFALDPSRAWLPDVLPSSLTPARRDRLRRSRLYLPGNQPKYLPSAGLHRPDGMILDLEDSVSPSEKDAARILVRNALRAVDFGEAERMVRINPVPVGFEDLDALIPENVHVVLIPKCESADMVRAVDERIQKLLGGNGSTASSRSVVSPGSSVYLVPIVETGLGVLHAYDIARASPNVVGLTIGLEDLAADIGSERTVDGKESFVARSMIVASARAAGVAPIDSVYSDVQDMEGLRRSVLDAKALGFEGKGCIHPGQIRVIHDSFAPTSDEVERALRIIRASEDARTHGLGAVSLGSKMIDPPVVKRAQRTVDLAILSGLLDADWRGRVDV
jgi:citrate lyase subunit beta / citryl-CoA lyase